jgi:hypothetical protein
MSYGFNGLDGKPFYACNSYVPTHQVKVLHPGVTEDYPEVVEQSHPSVEW